MMYVKQLALLGVCLFAVVDLTAGFKSEWIQHRHKHYLSSQKLTYSWINAQSFCLILGGHLAVPVNNAENYFLKTLAHQGGQRCTWLGAADVMRPGRWLKYPDLHELSYKPWYPGEPNVSSENCLCLWKDFNYGWADYRCGEGCHFICEM